MKVDFATFCYSGDAHRLHKSKQLFNQVGSNSYNFDKIIVVYQNCNPDDYDDFNFPVTKLIINDLETLLRNFGIDVDKPQYVSSTDGHHSWQPHIANHVRAIQESNADYIVFADNDCWIINQSDSWVSYGIELLKNNPDLFIISPNDGEHERKTQIFSQQMFLVKVNDFKNMDFNQPGWDGDVTKLPQMPEYHGMLEGRMALYCKFVNRYRYVLGSNYRYWHWNRIDANGNFAPMSVY